MHTSKATFTFIIILTIAISGTIGYIINVLNVNQERAELNAEIIELNREVEQLELELRAERVETEEETDETSQ